MTITLAPQQEGAIRSFREWYKGLPSREFTYSSAVYDPKTGDFEEVPHYTRGFDMAPYFLLEGFAGTGKSTVLPFLVEVTGLDPRQIVFCSPTGKAAKVMTKKMRAENLDTTATTIHRAIYQPKMMQAVQIEQDLYEAQDEYKQAISSGNGARIRELKARIAQIERNLERAYDENAPSFHLNVNSAAMKNAHLVIIDECSMVGADMAEDILSFGVPVLAIGDPGQLPPIGTPPGFCTRRADAQLTEIHRQALDNPIIWASMLIREGDIVPLGSHGGGLLRVVDRDDDDATFDLDRDAQIIVGTHEKRWQITRKLRKMCGFHGLGPMQGELMMISKNSRLFPDLVNGSMAFMIEDVGKFEDGSVTFNAKIIDEEEKEYTLQCIQATIEEHYLGRYNSTAQKRDVFRARMRDSVHELDFAYAITCHKSQGSQWNEVVVHDQSNVFKKDASRWLYTAVTRAAEKLTLIV